MHEHFFPSISGKRGEARWGEFRTKLAMSYANCLVYTVVLSPYIFLLWRNNIIIQYFRELLCGFMIVKSRLCLGILLLILVILMIGGCWDQVEIKERAIIIGLGIDKVAGDDSIRLTAQVINFNSSKSSEGISGGAIGTGNTKGSSQGGSSVSILTSTGKSFYDAIHNFLKSSSRRVTFSHNRIIILGKELAESGVSGILDDLTRDYQFRRTNWLLVAESTAQAILKSETGLGTIPPKEIDQMQRNLIIEPLVPPIILNNFLVELKSEGRATMAPLVELDQSLPDISPRIKIEKMAIFKNDHLCGILNTEESQGLIWLVARQKSGTLPIPYQTPNGRQRLLWVEISDGTSQIQPLLTKTGIVMEITCSGMAALRQTEDFTNNPKTIKQLEIKAANIIKAQVERAIQKVQLFNADILGFANSIHGEYPERWRSLKENWDQEFPRMKTRVRFQINIVSFGIIKDSVLNNNRQE
jgi:spore germination protein KC